MFRLFKEYPITALVSRKKHGSMKLLKDKGQDMVNMLNREKFLRENGIKPNSLVSANLVHGKEAAVVKKEDGGRIIPRTDGLITAERDLYLSVTVADCLPVFMYDRKKKVIALIHEGWRSLAQNISAEAVKKMEGKFQSNAKDILAVIGPGIGGCHFEAGEDVLETFRKYTDMPGVLKGNHLNLKKIAEIQLKKLGVERIERSNECTYCLKEKYFSRRREGPESTTAMMAVMGMKG